MISNVCQPHAKGQAPAPCPRQRSAPALQGDSPALLWPEGTKASPCGWEPRLGDRAGAEDLGPRSPQRSVTARPQLLVKGASSSLPGREAEGRCQVKRSPPPFPDKPGSSLT